jgi:organic hydroperoxide reductase OsmC/OhrA
MRNVFSPDHEKDRDRASRLLEKAEKTCLVVRSINSKVIW